MHLKEENKEIKRTPLYDNHTGLDAKMVEYAGWMMPINYQKGIISEHLATRKNAGLFDVSHMGRFTISGKDTIAFLQYVLTSNVGDLDVGESQYTIISDKDGIAIDDAYLYRFYQDQYLLVVNASNSKKDLKYLQDISESFKDIKIYDETDKLSMLSLQGPWSEETLLSLISSGSIPAPLRNKLSVIKINNIKVLSARTGYTGEPIGFELFADSKYIADLWALLLIRGAFPVGLGARDTLRLEAGLPLYGHELGVDLQGNRLPVFALAQFRLAVSFSPLKGDFIGRDALMTQFVALKKILNRDFLDTEDLPDRIILLELLDRGIARNGDRVFFEDRDIGYITSGTMVPYWKVEDTGGKKKLTDSSFKRSVALALLDSKMRIKDIVDIEIRGKKIKAVIMPQLLRAEAKTFSYPVRPKDILESGLKEKSKG